MALFVWRVKGSAALRLWNWAVSEDGYMDWTNDAVGMDETKGLLAGGDVFNHPGLL
jgi:hypothetical protein